MPTLFQPVPLLGLAVIELSPMDQRNWVPMDAEGGLARIPNGRSI